MPALSSERNSFYAKRQGDVAGDGASTRSGMLGHGRADSISGSIVGVTSPISASPRDNKGERSGLEEQDETEGGMANDPEDVSQAPPSSYKYHVMMT